MKFTLISVLDLSLTDLGFSGVTSLCKVSTQMLAQTRDVTELMPWATFHQERSRA